MKQIRGGDDKGAYLFDTFKEAFDYLSSQFNPVFDGWEEDQMDKYSNVNHSLTDADRKELEENMETDQLVY